MTKALRSWAVIASTAITTGCLLYGMALPTRVCIFGRTQTADRPAPQPKQSDVLGLGVMAGLFAVGILYKVRRSSAEPKATALRYLELQHPELEHPELALTSVPREALSSTVLEREVSLTR